MFHTESLEDFQRIVVDAQSLEKSSFHVVKYTYSYDKIHFYFVDSDGTLVHSYTYFPLPENDETPEQLVERLFPRSRYFNEVK